MNDTGGRPIVLVAMGGHAFMQRGEVGDIDDHERNAAEICGSLMTLVEREYNLVITHGNGPQVGNLLIQQEEAAREVPPQPLDVCDAMTQGQVGYMIQQTLLNEMKDARLDRSVVTLMTQVMVDREDPGFRNPTKPVGPFYSRALKEKYEKKCGHVFRRVKMKGERYRRVIPSPDPLRILEAKTIKDLLESGGIVIASGGGGIQVILDDDGHVSGVEAVIDKDLAG